MDLRPYTAADRDGCLAVFDSNTPDFFAPSERADYEKFLDSQDGSYFVMENEGRLLGCGGYALDNQTQGSLIWGMIHRDWHRNGLGRYLLYYRMKKMTDSGTLQVVRLDTSQRTAPFFEKQGFRAMDVVKDGYAPGLDKVEMLKKVAVCP